MAVGIFTVWQVLLYVARDRDTDEQALHAAHRRGIELPPEVTSTFFPGSLYKLSLAAYSDAVALVSEREVDLAAAL